MALSLRGELARRRDDGEGEFMGAAARDALRPGILADGALGVEEALEQRLRPSWSSMIACRTRSRPDFSTHL